MYDWRSLHLRRIPEPVKYFPPHSLPPGYFPLSHSYYVFPFSIFQLQFRIKQLTIRQKRGRELKLGRLSMQETRALKQFDSEGNWRNICIYLHL
jgi:hypothetical protein